jgi:hypothetical protein
VRFNSNHSWMWFKREWLKLPPPLQTYYREENNWPRNPYLRTENGEFIKTFEDTPGRDTPPRIE